MMLENQLPILVLKFILITDLNMIALRNEKMDPVSTIVCQRFPRMLLGFCEALSPLNVSSDYPLSKALKHFHLLDLMYHLIIVNVSPKRNPDEELEAAKNIKEISAKVRIEMPEDEETSGASHKVRSRKESLFTFD
ncbi:hypothetical protein TorRG33x02_300050 [Trema orientale]|uniref:Uncharacterized protein n=1 Tax=Trema orientale TaxID=63057 RepID=A0A2P5C2A5_TREOI|nr:hypothetical protein TorRG33x02_300050 [Trema orientale]